MIVTQKWLQEWIDITDIEIEKIVQIFNTIGLEVAEVRKIEIPKNVVIGKVLSCQKHPNADKLNVCRVDVGDEELQIVCGAANVVNAEYVAVAKVGALLPGDFAIKPAKLRGVESFGMICSSTELGLPQMENGIMILDESIGELEVGKELREYEIFQDFVIDIELTANRGDCLSILGIARELAAALQRSLKNLVLEEESSSIGIGRILHIEAQKDIESMLMYKAFSSKDFRLPFLIRYRVALIGEEIRNSAEQLAFYITHTTGVITRIYGYRFFDKQIHIKKDEKGYDAVYDGKKAAVIGVYQFDASKPKEDEEIYIVECSYIEPEIIAKKMYESPQKSDWAYYRSSRGSEPRVSLGIDYAKKVLYTLLKDTTLYSGMQEIIKEIPSKSIKVEFQSLYALIGQPIAKGDIVEILKNLGFEITNFSDDLMVVQVPLYRHDIENLQDVAEEVVRLYGIDNIQAAPLCFVEQNRINRAYEEYKKERILREFAIANGYFESVSYIFANKEMLQKFGFEVVKKELDLINPITKEMDTLRTSLVPNLLEQVQNNLKTGKKHIKLFEIGTIFNKERFEKKSLCFIFSGTKEPESVSNKAKPDIVQFQDIVQDVAKIIGDFALESIQATNALMHPYQSAAIIKNGTKVGKLYKLHTQKQEELELLATYIAEIDIEDLDLRYPKAKSYSIYQLSLKDLSIVVDKDTPFATIKNALQELPKEVKRFYPIDVYEDEKLGDKKSLTIRFAIQSDEKTLTEEEIGKILEEILRVLEEKVGASLR